jgi:ribose transport system substrate-binding protein
MFGEGYDAMERGEIWGSVYQSPTSDAQIAVDTAIKVAQGEEIPKKNFFETPKVTHKIVHLFKRPPF